MVSTASPHYLGLLLDRWLGREDDMAMGLLVHQHRCGDVQISGLFFLQETYPPILLKRKADRLRKETGNANLYTEFESDKTLGSNLRLAAVRAFSMLATQPIVQVIAVYLAYLFGLFYLILSTFLKFGRACTKRALELEA